MAAQRAGGSPGSGPTAGAAGGGVRRDRPRHIPLPGPGQESVWDYPRPPRLERVARAVGVEYAGRVVAASERALRVCETASPPSYYIPLADVDRDCLEPSDAASFCEWKGRARYWHLVVGERRSANAAWSYPTPTAAFAALRDHVAFFAGRVDRATVGEAVATPQPGPFYGGWITPEILGPFKGSPGSEGW